MDTSLYIERIERYETGAMNTAERSAFEAELAGNAELRQAQALYRQANEVIEQGIENKLRHQLNDWAAESARTTAKVVPMRSTWMRMAIAASVALLIGWFGWQWMGSQYTDQALYAGYYEKPSDSMFRAGGAGDAHPLQTGYDAMKDNDLVAAAAFFSDIPAESDYYSEAQYYLGHANLGLKNYDAAISAFRQCSSRSGSKFKEQAEWNLLLAYVVSGKAEAPAFRALLDEAANNPAHSYNLKAKELKEDLGSYWR